MADKKGKPSTGDGRTGGRKPAKTQVTAKTSTGTVLWKATVGMFKGKKKS